MIDFNNLTIEKQRLRHVEEPKIYDTLPKSFIINTPNPLSFIPHKVIPYFNERIFFNFIHRQCFNSCIDDSNSIDCYKNCNSKHLSSIELFKTAVEQKRKYDPFNSFYNLSEYQKRPKHMAKNIPSDTDYIKKLRWLQSNYNEKGLTHNTNGLENIFTNATHSNVSNKTNIFKMYLEGKFPSYTQKAIDRNNLRGRYSEYMKLNEKLGDSINDLMEEESEKVNWGNITGEDYNEDE